MYLCVCFVLKVNFKRQHLFVKIIFTGKNNFFLSCHDMKTKRETVTKKYQPNNALVLILENRKSVAIAKVGKVGQSQ